MHYSELNYDTYDEYLMGEEWQEIRDIFYRSGVSYRCIICHARRNLLVHKRSYYYLNAHYFRKCEKWLLELILAYLCHRCNKLVHFYRNGEKVELDYLFLSLREDAIFNRWDMTIRRSFRSLARLGRWFYYSFRIVRRKVRYLGIFL